MFVRFSGHIPRIKSIAHLGTVASSLSITIKEGPLESNILVGELDLQRASY